MNFKNIGEKIIYGFVIVVIIGGVIGSIFMSSHYFEEMDICAKDYGGKIVRGYCIYVEDGTSRSYYVWDNEKQRGDD